MITEISRGHVTLQMLGKKITIKGELQSTPLFVVYADSINEWDPPHQSVKIDSVTKESILTVLKESLTKRSIMMEIDK